MPGSVDALPNEVLFRIFSFLSCRDLVRNVRLVCAHFNSLLSHEHSWLLRLQNSHDVRVPDCQKHCSDFLAAHVCASVETEGERWGIAPRPLTSVQGHIGSVDVVHILRDRRVCVSGARDHQLCLWDLDKIEEMQDEQNEKGKSECKLLTVDEAHNGWIWSVASSVKHQALFSCGWDHLVKHWQLREASLEVAPRVRYVISIQTVAQAELGASALNVLADDDLLFVSSFDRSVSLFDIRTQLHPIERLTHHRRAVLSLAYDDRYLFSSGEDGLIVCVDKRTWTPVRTMQLGEHNFAHSLSLAYGQLWIGMRSGRIRLLDPSDLRIVNEQRVNAAFPVTQIRHTLGSTICIVKERELRVYTPGTRPRPLASFTFEAGPSRFDYRNGDLAIACGDGAVRFMTRQ